MESCITLAQTLPFSLAAMDLLEIVIVYLTCGAPFGVYFFVQHFRQITWPKLLLSSAIRVLLWIPYAFRLLQTIVTGKLTKTELLENLSVTLDLENKRAAIRDKLCELLPKTGDGISLYEFREIIERFAGLTDGLTENEVDSSPSSLNTELFNTANHGNIEVAMACLIRRNRKQIEHHQTLARTDLLNAFADIDRRIDNSEAFRALALEFVTLFDDPVTQEELIATLYQQGQKIGSHTVNVLENEVWTSKQTTSDKTAPLSISKAMTATASGND